MKLKICGMKFQDNIKEVASLLPDYLGFIFWEKSARYFDGEIPTLPESIKKVGVFVDADLDFITNAFSKYKLDLVQLHGKESAEFCDKLKEKNIKIIKAFSVDNLFDFTQLESYKEVCDYFLFDTKGKLPGGNGITFDWKVLENYKLSVPYFLSGGIGLDNELEMKEFFTKAYANNCVAIDVNSKFEIKPGLKNVSELKKIKNLAYEN
ncbi:MAG: phosphoribosylanthranilate isomerase [Flavobacterium sp.]|jgi:phosphoribosylanthranilate isomerase